MRIVFMGTPDFAVPSLKALLAAGHTVTLAVTQADKPVGRHQTLTPPPVKQCALENGIPVFQPKTLKSEESFARIAAEKPDVIVLDPPRDGIHPKALPKILSYGVNRIVYVSCKATSLARDLEAFLAAGYRLEKACCVDQFCETVWTEAVALLVKE